MWLVRHGETDWNAAGRVQGHDDSARLTPRGVQQVHRVAALLAGKDVECLYSSDLQRARQTAAAIAATTGAKVVTDRRLRERGFGRLEGAPTASLGPEATGIVDGRIADVECHPVGGESLDQLYRRCQSFVALLRGLGSGRDVVVVAHGGSIRMLRAAWAGTGPDGLAWTPVGNAAVFRLVLPPPHASEPDAQLGQSDLPQSIAPQSDLPHSIAPPSPAGSPVTTRTPSTVGRPS